MEEILCPTCHLQTLRVDGCDFYHKMICQEVSNTESPLTNIIVDVLRAGADGVATTAEIVATALEHGYPELWTMTELSGWVDNGWIHRIDDGMSYQFNFLWEYPSEYVPLYDFVRRRLLFAPLIPDDVKDRMDADHDRWYAIKKRVKGFPFPQRW